MIKINLLRREEARARPRREAAAPTDTTKQIGFVAIFLMTVAVCGYLWWDATNKRSSLQSQLSTMQAEKQRLEGIERQVRELERQRDNLDQRLTVLMDLRDNMRTPLYSLFFIYLAQLENKDVVLNEINQEGEQGLIFNIKGDATDETLEAFMRTLRADPLVQAVEFGQLDKTGARSFEIQVRFVPLIMLESPATGTEEDQEAASAPGEGAE